MSVIIHHKTKGFYLGSNQNEMKLWSAIDDKVNKPVVFETPDIAAEFIRSWETGNDPSDYTLCSSEWIDL